MEKKIWFFVLACILMAGTNACRKVAGEGPLVKVSKTVNVFNEILVNLPVEVIYKYGAVPKVEMEAKQNIIDLIETPVSNQQLIVRFKENVQLRSGEDVSIVVSSPALNKIVLNGSGNFTTLGTLRPNDIFVQLKGSGNISIPFLVATELAVVTTGSGRLKVANGELFVTEISLGGSGSVDLSNVTTQHATTDSRGSGSIRLKVEETLFCRITGSGSVYYKGNPMVEKEIYGSGKLVKN